LILGKEKRFRYNLDSQKPKSIINPQLEFWRVFVYSQCNNFNKSFSSAIYADALNGYSVDVEYFNDQTELLRAVLYCELNTILHYNTDKLEEWEFIGALNQIRKIESGSKIYTIVWSKRPWDDLSTKFLHSGMINDFQPLANLKKNRLVSLLYSNIKNQHQFIELENLKKNLKEQVSNRTAKLTETNIILNKTLKDNKITNAELEEKRTQNEIQHEEINKRNIELEQAFKKSSKQHIILQKLLMQNEQQNKILEEALEEIKAKNDDLQSRNEEIIAQRDHIDRQREEIEYQRDMAVVQRDKIATQQEEINDNILYASRIQFALLPPKEIIEQLLPKHFILNRPKDVVSGDFYWVSQNRNKTVVAVSDCTGHGISGAMMSMLGTAFLNEIINKNDITNPAQILEQLRERVISSLHQQISDNIEYSRDGMDISICIIDILDNTLEYSGANNPVYLFRQEELIELKPDKMPIGIHEFCNQEFNTIKLDLKSADTIYMFSDGFSDQFGGSRGKKLKYNKFKSILKELNSIDFTSRENTLNEIFDNWRGENEQIDDVMVLGFEIL